MRGYGAFAWYYDELTENVSYQKRADYSLQLIEKFGAAVQSYWIWPVEPAAYLWNWPSAVVT